MTNEALDMRYLPWQAEQYPQDGDAANEVTLARAFGALYNRTDTLRAFTTDIEKRLLTRYFAPVADNTAYPAAELARLAQEAASLPPLIAQAQGAIAQAQELITAQQGTLIYYQGTNPDGSVRLFALSSEQFREDRATLWVLGEAVSIPVVGLVY